MQLSGMHSWLPLAPEEFARAVLNENLLKGIQQDSLSRNTDAALAVTENIPVNSFRKRKLAHSSFQRVNKTFRCIANKTSSFHLLQLL